MGSWFPESLSAQKPTRTAALFRAAMGPPPKGTAKYLAYLRRQKLRRQRARAQQRAHKLRTASQGLVAAARREEAKRWTSVLDEERRKKNRYTRRVAELERQLKLLSARHEETKETLSGVQLAKTTCVQKNRELKHQVKELQDVHQELTAWQTWWGRLTSRLHPRTLALVLRLGRKRSAPDRCWGGGQ